MTTAVTTEVTTEITTTETPVDCTSGGYTTLSTGYYKLHETPTPWEQANSTCTSEGGYLVVLNNKEEAEVVTEFAFSEYRSAWVLIGNRNIPDGVWRSALGEPLNQLYNEWSSTRSNFNEGCGALNPHGLLDDMICSYEYPFVCEKPCS